MKPKSSLFAPPHSTLFNGTLYPWRHHERRNCLARKSFALGKLLVSPVTLEPRITLFRVVPKLAVGALTAGNCILLLFRVS
jgi:hypothetical protein